MSYDEIKASLMMGLPFMEYFASKTANQVDDIAAAVARALLTDANLDAKIRALAVTAAAAKGIKLT